jgi:ABC-2 type transport system permease protein
MLNYIRAELFRNFNRSYIWIYSGLLALLALMGNVIVKLEHVPRMNLAVLFDICVQMLVVPVFLVIAMIDMSTSEEQKNLTLKNVVSFGVSRTKIVVSKLIVSTVLSLVSAVIILVVFFGSGILLFGAGNDTSIILDDTVRLLAALPLWIGAISVGTFLALFFNNNTVFSFVYVGLFLGLPQILDLLATYVSDKFRPAYDLMLTTQLGNLKGKLGDNTLSNSILTGVIYIAVFAVISIVYMKKKEIK